MNPTYTIGHSTHTTTDMAIVQLQRPVPEWKVQQRDISIDNPRQIWLRREDVKAAGTSGLPTF